MTKAEYPWKAGDEVEAMTLNSDWLRATFLYLTGDDRVYVSDTTGKSWPCTRDEVRDATPRLSLREIRFGEPCVGRVTSTLQLSGSTCDNWFGCRWFWVWRVAVHFLGRFKKKPMLAIGHCVLQQGLVQGEIDNPARQTSNCQCSVLRFRGGAFMDVNATELAVLHGNCTYAGDTPKYEVGDHVKAYCRMEGCYFGATIKSVPEIEGDGESNTEARRLRLNQVRP
eukprot:3787011-Amphidinium_carterae.1